jgi:hypothetical protein
MLGIGNIIALLILTHGRPLPLLLLVPPHIVHLRSHEQEKRQNINPEQSFVALMVEWLVIFAVDV